MSELNSKGQMDTAEPLLKTLSTADLWMDVEKSMVAHIGTNKKPWLGHSGFLDPIGLNALKFFYMYRGFQHAFQGADLEFGRFRP